ncbi:hypothetical protein L6R52_16250 [Myxococcota bacterium]|nr:hypothetical protein [Myxococcota bacterium]
MSRRLGPPGSPPRSISLTLASLATVALGIGVASRADATVVKALTLAEKCAIAPVVVHGLVERVEVEWEVPDATLQTRITVKVIESLKGDAKPGARIIVRQAGGKLGELTQHIPGTSTYEPGEEAVLFLEPLGADLVELGVGIGKYAVDGTGQKLVTHAPEVAGARQDERGRMIVTPLAPMTPEPLASFLKKVRSHVGGIPTETSSPAKGANVRPPLKKTPR